MLLAEYLKQATLIDSLIGGVSAEVSDKIPGLIQSDHSGHTTMMIAGPTIRANYEIQSTISLLDTAPIIVEIIGAKPADDREGQVISEVFL